MSIMAELAVIFSVCLLGEGIEALLPIAFPGSVISLMLMMFLLLSGILKERNIKQVSTFFVANMGFFFVPASAELIEHLEALRSDFVVFMLVCVGTTVVVYLVTAWTVQLLMLRRRKGRKEHV